MKSLFHLLVLCCCSFLSLVQSSAQEIKKSHQNDQDRITCLINIISKDVSCFSMLSEEEQSAVIQELMISDSPTIYKIYLKALKIEKRRLDTPSRIILEAIKQNDRFNNESIPISCFKYILSLNTLDQDDAASLLHQIIYAYNSDNVEAIEMANEVLYHAITKSPSIMIEAISKLKMNHYSIITDALSPLTDDKTGLRSAFNAINKSKTIYFITKRKLCSTLSSYI